MVGFVWVKKVFSLTLVLNCLVTLACIAQILFNYYFALPSWQPYTPYLPSVSLLFLVVLAAVINIYPSASLGRCLHTPRFLFHHYVYGFLVFIIAVVYVIAFTTVPLTNLFLLYTPNVAVNAGRFFVLAGLTLFLDDLPDVSRIIEGRLNWLKSVAYRGRKVLYVLQLIGGAGSFFVFVAVSFWTSQHLDYAVEASFMIGTFFVTSVTSFVFVKRKAWLKLN